MSRMGDTIRAARVQAKMTEKAFGQKVRHGPKMSSGRSKRAAASSLTSRRSAILKILGVKNPVSEELEVAAEPDVPLRPPPAPLQTADHRGRAAARGRQRRLAGRAGRGGQARAGDGRGLQRGRPRAGARGGAARSRAARRTRCSTSAARTTRCAATACMPATCFCACPRRRWRTGPSPCFF